MTGMCDHQMEDNMPSEPIPSFFINLLMNKQVFVLQVLLYITLLLGVDFSLFCLTKLFIY